MWHTQGTFFMQHVPRKKKRKKETSAALPLLPFKQTKKHPSTVPLFPPSPSSPTGMTHLYMRSHRPRPTPIFFSVAVAAPAPVTPHLPPHPTSLCSSSELAGVGRPGTNSTQPFGGGGRLVRRSLVLTDFMGKSGKLPNDSKKQPHLVGCSCLLPQLS